MKPLLSSVGNNELIVLVEKEDGGFEAQTSIIGSTRPFSSVDVDVNPPLVRISSPLIRRVVFPNTTNVVHLWERSVTVVAEDPLFIQLLLPAACRGNELILGGGPNPSVYIACSNNAQLFELYRKDGQYTIDEVFKDPRGTTVAAFSPSGVVYSLNDETLHKKTITSSASSTLIGVIAFLPCGTSYPRTFTNNHILLECSNGYRYLCSISSGCSDQRLNIATDAIVATSSSGVAASLTSSGLTIHYNSFKTSCSPITLEDFDVTLEFFRDVLLIKSLNTVHYINTTDGCPTAPILIDTFAGIPECFAGNCTDYALSETFLAVTTLTDNLVRINFYHTTTWEQLKDYTPQYQSIPVLYTIKDRPDAAITTPTVATTTIMPNVTISTMPTSTSSNTTLPNSTTAIPTVLSTHLSRFTAHIAVGACATLLILVVMVICMLVVCCRRKKLTKPTQEEGEVGRACSMETSQASSLSSINIQMGIQATSPQPE